jgi:glycosyltransferase involved in cell wall biosynthesis
LNIRFVHWGVPRRDDASVRSLRAACWLAGRHRVTLTALIPQNGEGADAVVPPGLLPDHPIRVPGWTRRWPPWPDPAAIAEIEAALRPRIADDDWLWLGWWPLALCADGLRAAAARGATLTWDWDSLSLWNLTAARAFGAIQTTRIPARLLDGLLLLGFEARALGRIDLLSAPSRRDARWLRMTTGRPAACVRNCVTLTQVPKHPRDPQSVLFVGSLDYPPNRDGLSWFLRKVWPRVRDAVPSAEFRIVGRGHFSGSATLDLPGVRLVGEVEDTAPHLAASVVVVVPIHYGGGIPFKVLDAAAAGRPVVATPYVLGALETAPPALRHGASPFEFARHVIEVLRDPARGEIEGEALRAWVGKEYSDAQWEEDMHLLERAVRSARGESPASCAVTQDRR